MRHLGSLLLSLILLPVTFLLVMRGHYRCSVAMTGVSTGTGTGWHTDLAIGTALLAAAGLICALLMLTRWSPAGPALTGAALVAAALWIMLDLTWFQAHRYLGPLRLYRGELAAATPAAVVLGVALMATACSPRRWRRHSDPVRVTTIGSVPGYSAPPGTPQPFQPPATGNQDNVTTMPIPPITPTFTAPPPGYRHGRPGS